MKMLNRRIAISLIVMPALLGLALPSLAKTFNPVALINDGGYSLFFGSSTSTFLFVDAVERGSEKKFWVRVERDPGVAPAATGLLTPAIQPPTTVFIKYFPVSRLNEVLITMRSIETFGLVNPYVDGFVTCDGANSFIRYYKQTISMAYNCGANAPDADAATFETEDLLKALRDETTNAPDMTTSIPQ